MTSSSSIINYFLNREGSLIQCTGSFAKLSNSYWSDNQIYKWFKDGIIIDGETQRIYNATQTGVYSSRAVDRSCTITATSDLLTFGSTIAITPTFGVSTICSTGGQTIASVDVGSNAGLSTTYQWKRNGVNISGASTNYLTITQAGVYNVDVTQGSCAATSQGFEVKTSKTLDSITIKKNYSSFCNPSTINLSLNNTLQNVTYNWKKSGVSVGTGSSYSAVADGIYTLTATQGSCSTTSKPEIISLTSNPEILLYQSGNTTPFRDTIYICSDSPQYIFVNNYPSGTYQWFKDNVAISGATTTSYYTSQRGSYTFQVTSGTCVITSKSIFVENTFPKFSLNLTPNVNGACSNNIYTLDYTNKGVFPYYCATWKRNGLTYNSCASQVIVLEAGIYTASIQQGSCVVESEALKISIGELTTATITGNSTVVSGGSAKIHVSFTGTSPWTFTLSDGTTITTSQNPYILTVNPTVSTTYTLSSLIGNCGSGTVSGSAIITVGTCNTPTVITTHPISQTKCTGSSVIFPVIATGGGNLAYQWKKDGLNISGEILSTLTIINLKSTDLGNYSVEVRGNCGMVLSNVATLNINNAVPFNISPSSFTTTVGANIPLQAFVSSSISFSSVSWKGPNGYVSNSQSPIIQNATLNRTGAYTAFASNSQGCVGQAVASITIIAPTIILGNLTSPNFCLGQTSTLSFTPPNSVVTTYAVQMSNSNGVFDNTAAVLGTGSGSPISFTLPLNYSTGTYSNYRLRVIDTQNSTQISSPSPVIYFNSFSVSVQDVVGKTYLTICTGNSIKLYAKLSVPENNAVYEWQKDGVIVNGANASTYITNQLGQYTVRATQAGCSSSISNSTPIYSTTNSAGFYGNYEAYQCAGNTVTLQATNNAENVTYIWKKDGSTLPNQTNSLIISQSGTYSIQTIDPNCVSYNSNPISQNYVFGNTIPARVANADTIVACANYGVFLNSGNYFTSINPYIYQWKKNGIIIDGATNSNYSTNSSGVYSLQVTQGNCTTNSKSIVIDVSAVSSNIIGIALGSPNICVGTTPTVLSVQGQDCGGAYQWQKDGIDIASQTNSSYLPSQSGGYRIKFVRNNMITYSNIININASNSPTYRIKTSSDTINCVSLGEYYLDYSYSVNATFLWYKNGVPYGPTGTYLNMLSDGLYKLQVTIGSCVGFSQEINVTTRNYLRKPVITSDEGKILCLNNYTFIKAPQLYSTTYVWKKNGISLLNNSWLLSATESGNYSVSITQGNCTAESDPIKINIGDKQQSIKTADWSNPATWSCGTVPTVTEDVLINKTHTVSLPNGYTGFLKNLENNGSIIQGTNAQLKFLQN